MHRILFDHSPDAIFLTVPDGKILQANAAACGMFGMTEDELIGRGRSGLFAPDDPRSEALVRKRALDGKVSGEAEFLRKGGSRFTAELNSVIVEDGRLAFVILRDVSDRIRSDQRLRHLSLAIEQSPVSVIITDTAGRICYVNSRFVELTGYSQEEVEGQNPRFLRSGRTAPETYRELWASITAGKEWHGEFLNKKKNGDLFWESVSISPIVGEDGGISHFLAVKENITERKRSEAFLRQESEKLRSFYKLCPLGISLRDLKTGRFVDFNDAMLASTGYSEEEFRLLATHNLIPPEYIERETRELLHVRETGRFGPLEKEYIRRDGSRYPVLVNGVLVRDVAGNELLWSVVQDFSERKQLEQSLVEARNCAEAANRSKSEFLANMSHEIRTPLTAIIGMTHLLLETPLTPGQQEYAGIIHSSGESLLALLNDILDISKIEARKLDLEALDFDPARVLQDAIRLFAPAASEKGLELDCVTSGDLPALLRGDPGRLRQILANLLGNAIKFTGRGGVSVLVEIASEDAGRVTLRLSVTDTGVGIPRDKQAAIFSPFAQADGSTARVWGGTGLGLAISKQLAELLGGTIGVSSEPGHGSTFWFTAVFEKPATNGRERPAKEPNVPPIRPARRPPEQLRNHSCVLIVEDHFANQLLAQRLVEKAGYRSRVANNGREALDALASDDCDLVLMDCKMGEMDGFEATRRIRDPQSNVRNHDLPIIAMTAGAMSGDRERCLNAGMNDYLSKPLNPGELARALDRWLGFDAGDAGADVPSTSQDDSGDPAPDGLPVFDRDGFLQRVLGDQPLADETIRLFVSDTPARIQSLAGAIAFGRFVLATDAAHAIKGAAATIGAEAMSAIAKQIEAAARAHDAQAMTALLPALKHQFARLQAELQKTPSDTAAAQN